MSQSFFIVFEFPSPVVKALLENDDSLLSKNLLFVTGI